MKITVDGESVEVDELTFRSNIMRASGIKRPQDYDLLQIMPSGKCFIMSTGELEVITGDQFITARKSTTNG